MYIVIMGNGRVGRNLAIKLINTGNDVTIIDNDENSCSTAAAELDALIICGNATDTKTLEEASVGNADVFVAATGNDEANLLASILVKDYNYPKVIARVSNPDHEEAFKRIGIDQVISPELTAVSYLEKLITRPKVADLIICGKGTAELIDVTVKNKKIIGKTVGEVSPTDDYIIGAVYNGGILIPQDSIVLEENTKISILVKSKSVKKVTDMFTG